MSRKVIASAPYFYRQQFFTVTIGYACAVRTAFLHYEARKFLLQNVTNKQVL